MSLYPGAVGRTLLRLRNRLLKGRNRLLKGRNRLLKGRNRLLKVILNARLKLSLQAP